ncbi:sugar phosphate nucleotidyltransferase [Saccharicrinis sp. FJH54]|uniref:sugar phosphate nucleotidyltransferase n=1 Tax=Saccharicrinis sp. FJH54 TaxID=3344665 RepID=UPI0035D44201
MAEKRAVILAGGKGTRLKPFTYVLPKPLVPVGELPILEIIIRQLKYYGFNHITMAVNHQAEIIKAFFGKGEKWNLKIDYSLEDKPLSTMGPLKLIKDLPENFLVMNGDILSDIDFASFYEQHCHNKEQFTILSKKRFDRVEYGILETNETGYLKTFTEKPTNTYQVSTGMYFINRSVLEMIPKDTAYGFDHLMYKMLETHQHVKVVPVDAYWLDIGRPDDYAIAMETFNENRSKFLPVE